MKIALIDPSLFGWPYDLRLAKGLTDIGHVATIYGRDPDQDFTDEEDQFLQRHYYRTLHFPQFKRLPRRVQLALKGLSHIESTARLVSRFQKEPPDIIHFEWVPLAIVDGKFIPKFKKIAPTILTVHDSNPFNNSPSSFLQRFGARKILHHFDHLIVHTVAARKRLLTSDIPEERISIVPHGSLMDNVPRIIENARRREKRVQILLFGQIKHYKGADVLIRALSLLPLKTRENCLVRIVGRPAMPMEPLFSLVESLQLQRQVEFDLRFVPEIEVSTLVANADIMVFPYREIDASGVFMLAIGAGRPIIASNLGTFAELLGDQGPGALISPANPQELADSLSLLVDDPVYRRSEGEKISKLRDSVPSWREIARLTEAVYKISMSRRLQAD